MEGLLGQVVEGRYRIEAAIGRGAMGTVYRARHVVLGCEVAIKVLHEHLLRDPQMVARFEREAAIAAQLRHRHLVQVIDIGETARHQRLMVLELVRGESLAEIVARGPLAPARVVRIVRQLLLGLAHAHGAGLVHRDLKPENVLIEREPDGEVARLVDFGIAVRVGGDRRGSGKRLTESGAVLGTPEYIAPEQAYGAPPDPRTDLFALGVMAYEMLAGRLPFEGTGLACLVASLSHDPPPLRARVPGLAEMPALEAFARRLMAREPCARFASAPAALAALDAIAERCDADGLPTVQITATAPAADRASDGAADRASDPADDRASDRPTAPTIVRGSSSPVARRWWAHARGAGGCTTQRRRTSTRRPPPT